MYPKAYWWARRSLSEEYQKAYDNILQFIPSCDKLLDIGCGTGELLKRIYFAKKAKKMVGIDISQQLLAIAAANLKNMGITLIQQDILETSLPKKSFDCITFTFPAIVAPKALLSHACAVEVTSLLLYKVLENINMLLKPGGTFVQVEFDACQNQKELTSVYKQLCKEHNFTLQSLKFYNNEKIAADVDIRKEAAYRGYVVVVSKKM